MSSASPDKPTTSLTHTRIGTNSSSSFPSTSTPSLIDPDFSGLWSVSRLGHKKRWWSKIAGSIVISLFLYSWVCGFILPLMIICLFIIGYVNIAILFLSIIIFLYIIKIDPQPWICRIYMRYGPHYFDGGCSIIIEKEPIDRNPSIPICTALHPHGIYCMGGFFAFANRCAAIQDIKDEKIRTEFMGKLAQWKHYEERWPKIGALNNMLKNVPLFNFFLTKICGTICSASKKNLKSLMKQGISLGIYPGGFYEASIHKKGVNSVCIKNRKGLIKYCLEYGYEIYPSYAFGECETYYNYNEWISTEYKDWLNKYELPTIFAVGPYWYCSPLLPYSNTGIHMIYGCNTYYEKIGNPTQDKVDEVHKWYMDEIKNLFERNKWRFGYDDSVKLKIM